MWRNLRETEQNEAKPCSKRKLQWGGAKCVNAALPNLQPQGNASIAKQNLTMCVSVWKVVDMHCAFRQQESCPLPWTLNTCLHITISLQYVGNMHCHIKTLDGSSATLGAFSSILSPGASTAVRSIASLISVFSDFKRHCMYFVASSSLPCSNHMLSIGLQLWNYEDFEVILEVASLSPCVVLTGCLKLTSIPC